MAKLSVRPYSQADPKTGPFLEELGRRVESMPPGMCPVAFAESLVRLCSAQSCGKCVPCRDGLPRLAEMIAAVRACEPGAPTTGELRAAAEQVRQTADCAIGWAAAEQALALLEAFEDEFRSHLERGVCGQGVGQTVPCVTDCPAHVDIPAYITCVLEGDCAGAVRTIRKDNPFPTACAFVCEHPCEARCRRAMLDAPVNIRGVKSFAVNAARADEVATPAPAQASGRRVAVVGGGPSALSCAYFLALMGHSVELFEARKALGGMMRYGIPPYRLPRERLDEDIRAILGAGSIEVHLESPVDEERMAQLAAGFDAVYVAAGAQGGKLLDIEGVGAQGVMSAVEMLGAIGDGEYPDFSGKKVAVIGGGNVAMDCARTSVRAGAEQVTVVYRRRQEDMTALASEVESAVAEGVEMMCLMAPARIEAGPDGAVSALVCQPQRIGAVKRGRPAPLAADKPELRLEADIVLIAVGQAVESGPFERFGMRTERTLLVADEFLAAPGLGNVFTGGDCQTGPKTVIKAIAAGKAAARNIDELLGCCSQIDFALPAPPVRPNDRTRYGRVQLAERPARERSHDYCGVELPMSPEEAAQECGRCLRCDFFGIAALDGRGLGQW